MPICIQPGSTRVCALLGSVLRAPGVHSLSNALGSGRERQGNQTGALVTVVDTNMAHTELPGKIAHTGKLNSVGTELHGLDKRRNSIFWSYQGSGAQ